MGIKKIVATQDGKPLDQVTTLKRPGKHYQSARQAFIARLTELAQNPGTFTRLFTGVFGRTINRSELANLLSDVQNGNFDWMPKPTFFKCDNRGVLGFFVSGPNKVYIGNHLDEDGTKFVLAEEMGHYLRNLLSADNLAGDEGFRFASRFYDLPTAYLDMRKDKNDQRQLEVDGTRVTVELAEPATATAVTYAAMAIKYLAENTTYSKSPTHHQIEIKVPIFDRIKLSFRHSDPPSDIYGRVSAVPRNLAWERWMILPASDAKSLSHVTLYSPSGPSFIRMETSGFVNMRKSRIGFDTWETFGIHGAGPDPARFAPEIFHIRSAHFTHFNLHLRADSFVEGNQQAGVPRSQWRIYDHHDGTFSFKSVYDSRVLSARHDDQVG